MAGTWLVLGAVPVCMVLGVPVVLLLVEGTVLPAGDVLRVLGWTLLLWLGLGLVLMTAGPDA